MLLDCGEDKPDDHPVYAGLNDFTRHRLDQRYFLEREVHSRAFRRAEKRVLVHHIPIYGLRNEYNPCGELWGDVLARARFDVALNGHTHRFAWLPAGSGEGNNFPVMIGGGSNEKGATVAILAKRGKLLTLKVLNSEGAVLLEEQL